MTSTDPEPAGSEPGAPDSSPATLSGLLRESEWVQRLAHRLIADPHRADDLAQDAWLALLEGGGAPGAAAGSGPQPGAGGIRSPRAWLAGTLRHLAARHVRADLRRTAREQDVSRPESTPPVDELVAEVAAHREVTGALLELEEPFRTALLLRFHRGLPLKELARVQGVSLAAAHERVRRGVELLRARLDRGRGGDRRSWVLALWPLAERAAETTAPLAPLTPAAVAGGLGLGVVAMGTTAKVAAVCLVTVGGAAGLWQLSRAPAETRGAEPQVVAEVPPVELAPARERPVALEAAGRTAAPPTIAEPTQAIAGSALELRATAADTRAWSGLVLDVRGNPVGGVAVHLRGFPAPLESPHDGNEPAGERPSPPPLPVRGPSLASQAADPGREAAITQPDGSFEFELPVDSSGAMEVRDEAWVTVTRAIVGNRVAEGRTKLVVAPRGRLAGVVRDPADEPLGEVRLTVLVLDQVFARTGVEPGGEALFGSVAEGFTDADGRFELASAPVGEGLLLLVERDGYETERVDLGEVELAGTGQSLDVELAPLTGADVFWGTVVDAEGVPVPGATVSGGGILVKTDAEGVFRLERAHAEMYPGELTSQHEEMGSVLRAVIAGHLPAEVVVTPELESPVRLQLGAAPPSLRGRVVDGEGKPLSRVVVWTPDQTLLGMEMYEQAGSAFGQMRSLESVLAGSEQHNATTDGDGRFELKGLLERNYAVRAYDPKRLAVGEAVVARPGDRGIELVLRTADLPRVAGRLLSTAGEPLPGVRVQPMRFPFGVGEPWTQPQVPLGHDFVVTDAEGRFAFEELSTEHTSLSFFSATVKAYHAVQLAEEPDLEDLEVRVGVIVSFSLDLARDPDLAQQFEMLGPDGEPLVLLQRSGNVEFSNTRPNLGAGGEGVTESVVYSTTDEARTLVLYKGEVEVARRTVRLVPGEVNRIEL